MKSRNSKIITLWLGILVSLGLLFSANAMAYPAITSNPDNSIDWITNVTFAGINNDSVQDTNGYGDFTGGTQGSVAPGETLPFSITFADQGKIWIFLDLNQDNVVDPGEEIRFKDNLLPAPNPTTPVVNNISIPANANLGAVTMRVVNTFVDEAAPVPGDDPIPNGEVEDYIINITNPGGSTDPIITATAGTNGTITVGGLDATGANVYTNGTSPVFDITPAAGFFILDVLADGVSVGPVASYTFPNVAANHTIEATFSATQFRTITTTAGPNGRISPAGSVRVANGANQTFAILADPGFQVADVLVNGGSVGAVSTYTFTNVTADATISATFASDAPYDGVNAISSSNVENEWITNVTFGAINNNSNAEGYGSFIDVSTEVQQGGDYPISVSIKAVSDESITVYIDWNNDGDFGDANEAQPIVAFTNLNGPHLGTISVPAGQPLGSVRMRVVLRYFLDPISSGDLNIDPTYTGPLPAPPLGGEAEDYTLVVAAPDPAVNASVLPVDGTGGNMSVTINAAPAIPATVPPDVSYTLSAGDNVSFSITPTNVPPNSVYIINDLRVDGVTLDVTPFPTTYTFTNVQVTRTIHVDFTVLPTYTITATAGPNGTITPGTVEVEEGGSQTFTITPAGGYTVAGVVVDGVPVGPVTSYTFSNVTMNHTIVATFALPKFNYHMFLPAIIAPQLN